MFGSSLGGQKSLELDKICRVCLLKKTEMKPLFEENLLIVDMLMELAKVEIENTDGWPDKICIQCVQQVSRCHAFKGRVHKSDRDLRNYIKSLTVVIEEKPQIVEIPPPPKRLKTTPNLNNTSATIDIRPQITPQQSQMQTIQPQVIINNGQLHHNSPQIAQILTPNGTQQITQIMSASQLEQLIQSGSTIQMLNGQQVLLQRASGEVVVQSSDSIEEPDAQYFEDVIENTNEDDMIDSNIIEEEQDFCDEMSPDELQFVELEEIEEEDDEETEEEIEQLLPQEIREDEENQQDDLDEEVDKEFMANFINSQTTYLGVNRYACNLCRKEFKQMKWLQNHMKSHSNWIKANCKKQPQCEICHRSFKGPGMLRMHMKTHETIDIPTCYTCKKTFKSKSILNRHTQTHSQQKSYQCGNCLKYFSSPYTLNAHMTNKHVTEHCKFKCAVCDITFYNLDLLKIHMNTSDHAKNSLEHETYDF